VAKRRELTESRWRAVRGRPPCPASGPGRTAADRLSVNAVPYVAEAGVPWRGLPERFGSRNGVRRRFARRCERGVRPRLAAAPGEPDLREPHLDSAGVKAHRAAAGSRRRAGEKRGAPTPGGASAAAAAGSP
jgi:transposase